VSSRGRLILMKNDLHHLSEVSRDGGHSISPSPSPSPSPCVFASHPLHIQSPPIEMAGDVIIDENSPEIVQSTLIYDHQYEEIADNAYERWPQLFHGMPSSISQSPLPDLAQLTFSDVGQFSQHVAETIEHGVSVHHGSALFLTDGIQPVIHDPFYTDHDYRQPIPVNAFYSNWQHRNSTTGSTYTSPTSGTPSTLRSDISQLSGSSYDQSPNIRTPAVPPSPSVIQTDTLACFSPAHAGCSPNSTSPANILYHGFTSTGDPNPTHPIVGSSLTPANDDTPLSLSFDSSPLLSPLHLFGPSHAIVMSCSAPSSPSLAPTYQQHGSVESGLRRHSESNGSNYPPHETPLTSEVGKFRQYAQGMGYLMVPPHTTGYVQDDQYGGSQYQRLQEDTTSSDQAESSSSTFKEVIATRATLEAAEKRRRKAANFACSFCPQRLTSQDNLISEQHHIFRSDKK
jgi:hypothetical protein